MAAVPPQEAAAHQPTMLLTIILAQDQRVNAPEPKDIEEVPGCRTHPSKARGRVGRLLGR